MESVILLVGTWACGIIVYLLTSFFISNDGKVQRWRQRRACEAFLDWAEYNSEGGPAEFSVIHKNTPFRVSVVFEEYNHHFYTYDIFINGERAGRYHVLHKCVSNSYYFESINKRNENEVISILLATHKAIKKEENRSKEPKDANTTNYSYFK